MGYFYSTAEAGGGQVFLINQTFETATTGYDNSESWGNAVNSPDPVYTANILEGTQSLRINGSAATCSIDSPNFGDQNEVYFKFLFRPLTLPGAAREVIRFLINGAQATASELQIDASGRLVLFNGTNSVTTTTGMTINNNFTVWGHWLRGSGADAVATIAFAPGITGSETRPTSDGGGNGFASSATRNGNEQVDQFRVTGQFSTSGPDYVMDKLQVSVTDVT